jgi:hypothetical protein
MCHRAVWQAAFANFLASTDMARSPDDRAIAIAAQQLLAQYGEDAGIIAIMKAAEAAATNDLAASDFWQAVAQASESPLRN